MSVAFSQVCQCGTPEKKFPHQGIEECHEIAVFRFAYCIVGLMCHMVPSTKYIAGNIHHKFPKEPQKHTPKPLSQIGLPRCNQDQWARRLTALMPTDSENLVAAKKCRWNRLLTTRKVWLKKRPILGGRFQKTFLHKIGELFSVGNPFGGSKRKTFYRIGKWHHPLFAPKFPLCKRNCVFQVHR